MEEALSMREDVGADFSSSSWFSGCVERIIDIHCSCLFLCWCRLGSSLLPWYFPFLSLLFVLISADHLIRCSGCCVHDDLPCLHLDCQGRASSPLTVSLPCTRRKCRCCSLPLQAALFRKTHPARFLFSLSYSLFLTRWVRGGGTAERE